VQEQPARTRPKGPRGAPARGHAQCSGGQEASPGGHPGCLPWDSRKLPPPTCGAQRAPSWSTSSRHLGKVAQRSPGKGPCSVLQRKAKKPQKALLAHGGGKKSLPPPQLQGIRGHPGGARKPGSNLVQKDERSRDKWSCSMLQRKAKNPRGPVPMCPRGKFLPDPSTGDRLFPEHGSKTWLLVQQAVHASQEMPKPYSPPSWSHLRGFQEWPSVPSLTDLQVKNPSRTWQNTSGCSKDLGALVTSLHPLSYGCFP